MKYIFRILVGIIFVFGFQPYSFGAETCKIGVIDMQKLQEKSSSFRKIREKLRLKFEVLQKKLDKEKKELLKIEEELKKQSMMLSLDAKENRQKELAKKSRHYKYLYDEYNQEMKEAELEANRRVGKEIEKLVEKIGKKDGYTLILERRGVGLIFRDDAVDITDRIIKAYDQPKR